MNNVKIKELISNHMMAIIASVGMLVGFILGIIAKDWGHIVAWGAALPAYLFLYIKVQKMEKSQNE